MPPGQLSAAMPVQVSQTSAQAAMPAVAATAAVTPGVRPAQPRQTTLTTVWSSVPPRTGTSSKLASSSSAGPSGAPKYPVQPSSSAPGSSAGASSAPKLQVRPAQQTGMPPPPSRVPPTAGTSGAPGAKTSAGLSGSASVQLGNAHARQAPKISYIKEAGRLQKVPHGLTSRIVPTSYYEVQATWGLRDRMGNNQNEMPFEQGE
jgi:hypothetical protein